MAKVIGTISPVFGLQDALPLEGFPEGKVRLRLRCDNFAKAFVKTPNGIRGFYITAENGKWSPSHEFGRNETR